MINEENLRKLYSGVLGDVVLTTKQMSNYGFNSKDLNELIEKGSIERVKRGLYSLKSIDQLFNYGKKLIAKKEYERATLCFEKCFEIDPKHLGACFQLFLRSIQKEHYQRAFELYERLVQSENEFYSIDANYYLYLLSIITEVPEKYKEYARHITLDDIKIPFADKRYKDIPLQNRVRIAALQRKFPYALKQLKELITKHGNLTVQDIITRTLLLQAVNAETISKNTIVSLIKEKKYDEVVNHLLDKQDRHNLSIPEEYILKLAKKFIEISESSKIPNIKSVHAETLFEAIDTDNYNIALRLCTEYNEKYNISNDSSAINILLNDICLLIDSLCKPKHDESTFKLEENKKAKTSSEISQPLTIFSSIISYLMKNELDDAFYSLRNYMELIGKADYEFLIINLIKISLLEKDIAFTKPMIALTLISKDNYSFDISSYIQEFYVALCQNRFEEARIYLDIISKANKLGLDCVITDSLYQVLESSEKILNYKRDYSILEQAERAIEDSKKQSIGSTPITVYSRPESEHVEPPIQKQYVSSPIETKSEIPSVIKTNQDEITQDKRDSEKNFIAKRHEELVERKGIILLKPMDEVRINRIFDIVGEYPDMVAFVIGDGNKRQVVLRYKPINHEFVDTKSLLNFGNEAYKNGNYDDCIETFLQLLQFFNEPRAFNYAKLGLSYMKKFDISLAIDYLTIATALAKKENLDFDYSDLILKLKGEIEKDDIKPRFKMIQDDFDHGDVNKFYGIENFEEINSYIVDSGLDVESACQQMNLTPEQIDIIRLIYSREFYIQGNFDKGDLFLRSVEESKNKTNITKKLFYEIRKNKRFYQYRQVEKTRSLVLTLVPKKNNGN